MTALRPEREGAPYGEYDKYAYGGADAFQGADAFEADAFEAALDQSADPLSDPLSDPLPGQHADWFRTHAPSRPSYESRPSYDGRAYEEQAAAYGQEPSAVQPYAQAPEPPAPAPAPPAPHVGATPVSAAGPALQPTDDMSAGADGETVGLRIPHPRPVLDDETVALRTEDTRKAASSAASGPDSGFTALVPPGEGRAARRRAAKRGGGRHSAVSRAVSQDAPEEAGEAPSRPLTRLEARRAERARRPSPAVLASRAIGEVFITTGVLMLLFVTYQLWWTNVRAHQQTDEAAHTLQDDWANGKRNPGAFEPGQGFAILHIPKLDVVVPIAEGIDKQRVLDHGMVGHYGKDSIPTAMPDAKTGNFGVAGHRNTHGEPFRYINRLGPGDPIVIETQEAYYVYKMTGILPQTSPKNTSVLDPIPKGSGFTRPGRYITLTTCTPEFTSTYRMIVWGKMVEERPRSKGKPDALIE